MKKQLLLLAGISLLTAVSVKAAEESITKKEFTDWFQDYVDEGTVKKQDAQEFCCKLFNSPTLAEDPKEPLKCEKKCTDEKAFTNKKELYDYLIAKKIPADDACDASCFSGLAGTAPCKCEK